jgi:hypothetical protein
MYVRARCLPINTRADLHGCLLMVIQMHMITYEGGDKLITLYVSIFVLIY